MITPASSQQIFIDQLSYYTKYNYFLLSICTLQLFLMISVFPSQMLCRQALPIALYNIIAEAFTIALPLSCIVAVKTFKYFNTVLAYSILILAIKVIQIISLMLFGHIGTCSLPLVYRLPVALFFIFQLCCLSFSTWILKRVRRFDRQSKAATFIKRKQFLSD